jgi:hypothetical protein
VYLRNYRRLILVPGGDDQKDEVTDEKGHNHADEVRAQLRFDRPVVPVDLFSASAFETSEATGI